MNVIWLEANGDIADLQRRVQQIAATHDGPVYVSGDGIHAACENLPRIGARRIEAVSPDRVAAAIADCGARAAFAFLPQGASYSAPDWDRVRRLPHSVMAWPVAKPLPAHSCAEPDSSIDGWVMSADLAGLLLPQRPVSAWRLGDLGAPPERLSAQVNWLSSDNVAPGANAPSAASGPPPLTRASRVLAVIPHFACEPWLAASLVSLVRQTRAPDGIVVIDDASAEPPVEICRQFPEVTLLRSTENAGPYRLVQQVIDATGYDGYLFQDADDWSCVDRVELTLAEIERTGAELIGTQEIRLEETGAFRPASYPLDVTAASEDGPQHPLLHPTSMVARSLVERLGGFATGLRFSGDTEFLYRAVFDARIVNLATFSYVHRKRRNSLVTSPETGMQSRKRQELLKLLHDRADRNVAARRLGQPLDLAPLSTAPSVVLRHVCGPSLRPAMP